MEIREYKTSDCNEIADLFYNTVHYINPILFFFFLIC